MLPERVESAFTTLAGLVAAQPELADALARHWRSGGELPPEAQPAASVLASVLPALTLSATTPLSDLFSQPAGEVLFGWCAASTWRRDAVFGRLLQNAAMHAAYGDRVPVVARGRVVEGPLSDALACAALVGDGAALRAPENAQARSRLEILIWEAGASAVEVPVLARWVWSSRETFDALITGPAHGALRGRVLAARCLEISARGLPASTEPELVKRTLQTLQPLLLHPEPLVWVHAARALGRLTGALEEMQGTILDWVVSPSQVLRQRAMTAFAALPAARFRFVANELISIIESPDEDAWALAAIAAATPYLFNERKDIWDRLAGRVLRGDGGAIAARALARGLATLWRRGTHNAEIEQPFRALRELARAAPTTTLDDKRRWIEVIAVTDAIDAAERDPLDLELGLENLTRIAAQYDDEEADARAARFASSLGDAFEDARAVALGGGTVRQRAAALNALEGCARAFALRLWGPLLATRPTGEQAEAPDLEETWKLIAHAPAAILDLVRARRKASGSADLQADRPLEVLAIRLGGYALDACEEDAGLGPGRGPTAHQTCLWLRKLEGLAAGTLPRSLKNALSMLLWRLVDTTRGTALGEVDDVRWLGPFAAWWALVIERPAVLQQLTTALPMMERRALDHCCDHAEALRTLVASGGPDGGWGDEVTPLLEALHARDTELAHALSGLARALASFVPASGQRSDLDTMCLELVLAADRLMFALADPVKALHPANEAPTDDSLARNATENAPRVSALVARAIRGREVSKLDVWLASLGPITSALVEGAIEGAIERTVTPPPLPKKKEPTLVSGYELVKNLGEGGMGTVWLVRRPGGERFFVLKIPKADALANASETERAGILASFGEEANALAGLYHPHVASIIDRGVSSGVPYLVLEYLIGADLKHYSAARLMTLFELRRIVEEVCSGLHALHKAGLVHRDIKPANLWLRLPLKGGEKFDPDKHRDPAQTTPLSTVVIDFGMVRAIRVPPEVGGKFVAGTAGYIAPEQVLDPVELDPRSDVYALAGVVYNVTSGRAFFDDVTNARDRIIAHMKRDPFEDEDRLRAYPAAVAKLLHAATAKDPADRPTPLEFSREFARAL